MHFLLRSFTCYTLHRVLGYMRILVIGFAFTLLLPPCLYRFIDSFFYSNNIRFELITFSIAAFSVVLNYMSIIYVNLYL